MSYLAYIFNRQKGHEDKIDVHWQGLRVAHYSETAAENVHSKAAVPTVSEKL